MSVPEQVRKQTEAVQQLYSDLNPSTESPRMVKRRRLWPLPHSRARPTVLSNLHKRQRLMSRVPVRKTKRLSRNIGLFRVCTTLMSRA
jgi:hypothetical protein